MVEMGVLLVIALILGVLVVAILEMKRESARKISCVSNMKNIGLSMRMYSNVYNNEIDENGKANPFGDSYFPNKNGRAGLQMLADEGFLEATKCYICPSTNDKVYTTTDVSINASYAYAGGITESTSVASALASDRALNHTKYGNILFVDGHVKGFAGISWSSSRGNSILTDF
jgi:prepilin-type processing-associated H-X9-DG protein